MKFSVLERQLKEKPDDPDLNAQMAYEHWARRDLKEARPFAEKALELKPHHPLASYVKAQLLVTIGDEDAALEVLEPALDPEAPERTRDRFAGRADDEGRPARRSREALRARPQGRPGPHQVDIVAGANSPAPEEDGDVPGDLAMIASFDADNIDVRRDAGRAIPGRRKWGRGREVGELTAFTSTSMTR